MDFWKCVEFVGWYVVGVVLRAADTFQASTAALSEGIPQLNKTLGKLDKTVGRTGQTLRACTAAECF